MLGKQSWEDCLYCFFSCVLLSHLCSPVSPVSALLSCLSSSSSSSSSGLSADQVHGIQTPRPNNSPTHMTTKPHYTTTKKTHMSTRPYKDRRRHSWEIPKLHPETMQRSPHQSICLPRQINNRTSPSETNRTNLTRKKNATRFTILSKTIIKRHCAPTRVRYVTSCPAQMASHVVQTYSPTTSIHVLVWPRTSMTSIKAHAMEVGDPDFDHQITPASALLNIWIRSSAENYQNFELSPPWNLCFSRLFRCVPS